MKKLLLILAVVYCSACNNTSGSGNIVSETRNTGEFTGLAVTGDFDVVLSVGDYSVKVEADDNIIGNIRTKVKSGELMIDLDERNVDDVHMKIYVSAPSLNSIKTSASAEVVCKDIIRASRIGLQASSASEIQVSIDAPESSLDASSGGELTVSGRTRDLNAESSSGSSLNAHNLKSEHTIVSVSSGATASVHASVSLNANASSGGNISYTGGANVKKSVSSGGEIVGQ